MADEKRRFSRVVFAIGAQLTVGERVIEVAEIVNLSVGGCQLDIGGGVAVGTPCTLLIVLNPADSRSNVEVAGEIVRVGDGSVGVKFTSIEPDDLGHLQNIIRYNSQDPDRVEQEIDNHPGLV